MKLIYIPLGILIIISIFAQLTASVGTNIGQEYNDALTYPQGYYDVNMHMVAYANQSAAGEAGYIYTNAGQNYATTTYEWVNGTTHYPITINGVHPLESVSPGWLNISSGGFWALMGILAAVMVIGTVAGFHFLSSGETDFSVNMLVKGIAFGSLWAFFAALSYGVLVTIPMYMGTTVLFILSAMYLLGVVNQFGHPGDE